MEEDILKKELEIKELKQAKDEKVTEEVSIEIVMVTQVIHYMNRSNLFLCGYNN